MYRMQRNGTYIQFQRGVSRLSVVHLSLARLMDIPSSQVLKAYETQGFEMLRQAFNEQGFLEKLTGLDELHKEGEAAFESVDWDEDVDEDRDSDF